MNVIDDTDDTPPPRLSLGDTVDKREYDWVRDDHLSYIDGYSGPAAGLTFDTRTPPTPLTVFSKEFDIVVWTYMVEQTNIHAQYQRTHNPANHRMKWVPVNMHG